MPDLVGKTLKDFHVLRRLGRGAMADVYLAQQESLARQVALKVLSVELARDPNYVRRFHNEARAAAALVHGGIVQVYEVGQQDSVHFIAQEYVAGRNLGELVRSRGSLPPELVVDILRQVAAALAKAASQGVVHRDIKPENIMLSRTGEVKVADFGLARVMGDTAASLTQVGVTMGTPLYMSPEQIEGRPLDARSDIYSLGVTAYHMLAGAPPFTGDTPLAVALAHLNQPPPPLRLAEQSDFGRRLSHIVERMMAKKPEQRFGDPGELLAELNALAGIRLGEGERGRGGDGEQNVNIGVSPSSSLAELLRTADERAAVTTRLDELMKTAALARAEIAGRAVNGAPDVPRQSRHAWLAVVAVGLLAGVVLAAMMRPPSLLAGAQAGAPRSETVWGQLYHAKMVDTEAAWLAVIDYFPDAAPYYHNLARQGLAYYYLTRSGDYHKAIQPLQELVELGSADAFRAFGHAGLVVAYAHLGDDEQAYYANQALTSAKRAALVKDAPRMGELLEDALDELAERI